jgi:hypothetical protein
MQRSAALILIVLLACVACGGDAEPSAAESGGEHAAESATVAQEAPSAAGQARSAAAPAAAQAAPEPAAAAPPAAARTRRLESFDTDALFWAMYHHAGVEPPIRDWVAANWRRTAYDRGEIVDEFFDSDAFIDGLEGELRPGFEEAADIGFARVPMRGELGTYDTQFEELYIEPFAPGSGVRAYSRTTERETRLQFSNALEVYAWPLSPAEAQDVIARLPLGMMGRTNRSILLEVDLRLTSATVDSRTGNGRIDAEIIGYQLFAPGPGGGRGELLREVTDIR